MLGIVGLLLSATAFRAAPLAVSLPVIDTVEPVSAVLLGTMIFGERLAASPAGLVAQLAGAAAAVTGILVLGRTYRPNRVRSAAAT